MDNKLAPCEQKNIKGLLVMAGIKQVEIARGLKVSRSFVSDVVAGKKKTRRIQRAIARALGMSVADLFPTRKNTKEAA